MQYTLAYLTVFGVALGASLVATPLAKGLARRVGVLDQPSQRKVHLSPTPLMGGLAIYAGFWASVLAISRFQVAAPEVFLPDTTRELAAIFVATLTLMVVGVVDDKLRGGYRRGRSSRRSWSPRGWRSWGGCSCGCSACPGSTWP